MLNKAFDRTQLEIRYLLDAPRERVFRAWTEPELLKNGFGQVRRPYPFSRK